MPGRRPNPTSHDDTFASTYSTRYFDTDVPKYAMPDASMPARAAYQIIHDELTLDGNPALNLASFVTTWMEPEARDLVMESIDKNFIDHEEYPVPLELENRCVKMIAGLYNAPDPMTAVGAAAIGSSEAIMLALLAHKWSWKARREANGQDVTKPNIVYGADTHVVWDKFARYFDVEARVVPMQEDRYILTVDEVEALIDENTIAVGCVLGTTYSGEVDPIADINTMLDRIALEKGWEIPIHVDAASGGFVTPFAHPDLEWDFRLGRVASINVSGHKFGLVYPGIGWVVFRDASYLPKDLIFEVNYLGSDQPTYTLNFSRGTSMVVAQYYNFLRLGREGYTKIAKNMLDTASMLNDRLVASGRFSRIGGELYEPVVTVRIVGDPGFDAFHLAAKLREQGWIVPAYTLPPKAEHVEVLRIVVKENFSRDMAEQLLTDIDGAWTALADQIAVGPLAPRPKTAGSKRNC